MPYWYTGRCDRCGGKGLVKKTTHRKLSREKGWKNLCEACRLELFGYKS